MTYDEISQKENKENRFLIGFSGFMIITLFSFTAYTKQTPYFLLVGTIIVVFSIILKQLSRERTVVFQELTDTFYLINNDNKEKWNIFLYSNKERLDRVKQRNQGFPYLTIKNLLNEFNTQQKWRR